MEKSLEALVWGGFWVGYTADSEIDGFPVGSPSLCDGVATLVVVIPKESILLIDGDPEGEPHLWGGGCKYVI